MSNPRSDVVLWRTIEAARAAGGARERLRAVRHNLERMSREERAAFHGAALGWHSALDREALWMAAVAMMGFCSDDGFDSFRAGLLLQGRASVEAAVRDPDSMADWNVVDLPSAEGLLGAAERWPGELSENGEPVVFRPDTSAWPSDVRPNRVAPLVEFECAVRFPRLWASANDVASSIFALVARAEWTTAERLTNALVRARAGAPGLALFLRGVVAFERGDWPGAVADFREAEGEEPRSPAVAFVLAEALYREGDAAYAPEPAADPEAVFAFFERRPREHEAAFRRALALRSAGQTTAIDAAAQRLPGMLRVDWERAVLIVD